MPNLLSAAYAITDESLIEVYYHNTEGVWFSVRMDGLALIDVPMEMAVFIAEHFNVEIKA